jgi:hypothetical protein
MSKPKPIVPGAKYNLLTVVSEAPPHVQPNGRLRRKVNVLCDCGNTDCVMLENLYAGYSRSCGCVWEKVMFKHGMSRTSFKECHVNMKARCDNSNHPSYPNYGARGITYCDNWKTLNGFIEDMFESYVDTLTLDRIDVNGMYCKENCRWTGNDVQGHNKRKMTDCLFEHKGIHYNNKSTRYVATIGVLQKSYYLATFDTIIEAAKAYDDASENLYGDRPNGTEATNDLTYRIVMSKLKEKSVFKDAT